MATPHSLSLEQNYPNPFNPSTNVRFGLAQPGHVALEVHDMRGILLRTVVSATLPSGIHSIQIDGNDMPCGTYIYRLKAGDHVLVRKMLLVR